MQQNQRTNQQMQQQEPTAAEINLMLNSLGLGLPPNETLQLGNWDLKKLAMYLVSKWTLKQTNNSLQPLPYTYSHNHSIFFFLFKCFSSHF